MTTAARPREAPAARPARGDRFVRNGAIYVVGTIAQRGLAVLLLPLVTRVLGVDEFGVAGTAAALATLLGLVYGLGLNFAIVRVYYDDDRSAPTAGWAAVVRAQAGMALLLAAATYITGPWWSGVFAEIGWVAALKIAVLYAWLTAIQATIHGVLRAAERPIAFLVVTTLQVVLGTVLGIVFAGTWGAAGYIAGLTTGTGLAVAVGLALTYRRPAWSRHVLIAGLALSLPALLHQLSGWGIDTADRLLVAAFLGVQEVAQYQVAYLLGTAMILLLTAFQSAWAPHFIGRLTAEQRRVVPTAIIVPVTVTVTFATGLVVLAAPYLFSLLAPPSFGSATTVTAVVASATLSRASYFVAVVVLLEQRKTGRLATASLLGMVVNIGLNLLLIPVWGLEGAAAVTVVSAALQAVIVLLAAEGQTGSSLRRPTLLAVWAAGTASFVVLSLLPENGAGIAVRVGCAAALVLALLVALRSTARAFGAATSGSVLPSQNTRSVTAAPQVSP